VAKVIWTDSALDDLAQIFDYMARETQSLDRAEEFCLDLVATTHKRLHRFPASGALVPDLAEWKAREIYLKSYRIIYTHRGGACYVNMCIHSSRDFARYIDRVRWIDLPGAGSEARVVFNSGLRG
jgi:plasmid stabilization system protein ParE